MGVPKSFSYMRTCEQCGLHKSRTQVVIGRGPWKNVRYMFIGEAPGANEDETGQPFVGAAGNRLEAMMADAELDPEQVYITNVVKCRPPENRKPTSREVKQCSVHLQLQIKIIKPKLLVLIGNTALNYFFPDLKIMSVHGTRLPSNKFGIPTFAIIHPAATLHNPRWSDLLLADLRALKEVQLQSNIAIGPRVIQ